MMNDRISAFPLLLALLVIVVACAACDTGDDEPAATRSADDDDTDDDLDDDNIDDDDHGDDDDDDDDDDCSKGCLIDDICYPDGVRNPQNRCQKCDAAGSAATWTNDNGAACDDGEFCNGADSCQDGECTAHTGDPCPDDGLYCNGDEYCNEDRCAVRDMPNCPDDGEYCNGDEYCDEDQDACASTGDPCEELAAICFEEDDKCEIGAFASISAGQFVMGSPVGEMGHCGNETQHTVTLTHGFEMMTTEVTYRLFIRLMGYGPSQSAESDEDGLYELEDYPVQSVTWYEALAFCNALSELFELPACFDCTGEPPDQMCELKSEYATIYDCPGYRLPTESEWEYAARAGTTTPLYNGDIAYLDCTLDSNLNEIGWYCGNSGSMPALVGHKAPNDWGLYDMCGNAGEMVWDWYEESYPGDVTDPTGPESGGTKVLRSGNWYNFASYCRVAARFIQLPDDRSPFGGFRVVRTL